MFLNITEIKAVLPLDRDKAREEEVAREFLTKIGLWEYNSLGMKRSLGIPVVIAMLYEQGNSPRWLGFLKSVLNNFKRVEKKSIGDFFFALSLVAFWLLTKKQIISLFNKIPPELKEIRKDLPYTNVFSNKELCLLLFSNGPLFREERYKWSDDD